MYLFILVLVPFGPRSYTLVGISSRHVTMACCNVEYRASKPSIFLVDSQYASHIGNAFLLVPIMSW